MKNPRFLKPVQNCSDCFYANEGSGLCRKGLKMKKRGTRKCRYHSIY